MLIKKIQYLIRHILSLIFLAGWVMAGAQQADSISGYLKEAASNNPGLKARYSAYLAALEKVPQAGALPDPEMQFSFFLKPMELMQGSQVADLRLMQMAPWFGTLKAARDEASKMALAKYQEAQSYRNELFLQVKSSWYEVYRTRQEIGVTEENLALLKSLERMALIRFRAAEAPAGGGSGAGGDGSGTGMVSGQKQSGSAMAGSSMSVNSSVSSGNGGSMAGSADASMGGGNQGGMVNVLRVQIEIGTLENRLESLKDLLITAESRFNGALNRKPESAVFVPDSLTEVSLPGALTSLADSIANNPMIRMYEADREANEARIIMATKMGYPMVGIGFNYSLIRKTPDLTSMMNGKDMIMPMVTATLPIYRKKYGALRREAGFLRDAAAESAINAGNELTVKYREAIQLYNDAGRRSELFERQASLAEKTIVLLTRSFSTSGTDFEEILRMRLQLLDYQFRQIEALVDRNTAVARLESIIAYQ